MQVQFPYLSTRHIVAAAEGLRVLALGEHSEAVPVDLDVIVFEHLCERFELAVVDDADLPDVEGHMVLGRTTMRPGRIEINRQLRHSSERGRFRFTLAHEIGHWILHRDCVLAAVDAPSLFDDAPSATITTLHRADKGTRPREEIQADLFAAALLIGRQPLHREVHARFGTDGIRRLLLEHQSSPGGDLGRMIAKHRVAGLSPLHEAFDVSVEAMRVALDSRGYLSTIPTLL